MNRELTDNIEKLHTTPLGMERIKRNLGLTDIDPVEFCRSKIMDENAAIYRHGKNWYIRVDGCIITVNAGSFTIITAHRDRQVERITKYETMMNEASELIKSGEASENLSKLIGKLDAYYQSSMWKRDYADDEDGLLPKNLKRGVLSEDGIYNLLESFDELSD